MECNSNTPTVAGAAQDLEDVGCSSSAEKLLEKYLIGGYEGGDLDPPIKAPKQEAPSTVSTSQLSPSSRAFTVLPPVILILIAIALAIYGGGLI